MTTLKESRTRSEWLQENATLLAQQGEGDIYKMTLKAPEIARRAVAGQFVEVRCVAPGSPAVDPLLRRPISICEIQPEEGIITLIYRVVGRGTDLLSQMKPGQQVDLLGPMGHSFPDPAAGVGRLLLVGGGLGIPPMVGAAARAVAARRYVAALLGARSVAYLAGAPELTATGIPVTLVTEDGSAGSKGLVTEPLRAMIAAGQVGEVWACGPEAMLAAIKELCVAAGVPCFVSLERFMACGFGACIGCTVPKAGEPGYFKACQDGPVFPAEEVILGGH